VAASFHAGERGNAFVIMQPSAALAEVCATLGLADWLKQWSAL
jgi:hypothetical protein